jgi:LacI family transcriptional regulator
MSRRKSVTIKDVAKAAGVSYSTVSKVLSGVKRFPSETEARVRRSVKQLSYTPNPHAKSMVTGLTYALGIKVLDIANPHFGKIVKSAQREARSRGYDLLITDSQEDPSLERQAVQALAVRCDGLMLAGSRLSQDELLSFDDLGKPIVFIGVVPPINGFCSVTSGVAGDKASWLTLALDHLASLGHDDIAFMAPAHAGRFVAELEAERSTELKVTVVEVASPDIHGGYACARDLLQRDRMPTAIVGYNDLVCYGVLKAARELGIGIPDDVSLVGANDLPFSEITSPPLTSISSVEESAGAVGVSTLVDSLEGRLAEPRHIQLEVQLIERDSTAAPHSGKRDVS